MSLAELLPYPHGCGRLIEAHCLAGCVTDAGFKNQSAILARLFVLVESGGITAPLFDPAVVNDPTMTNRTYVQQFCVNLLRNAFPHVQLYVKAPPSLVHPGHPWRF